jgi:hypothetical protein
MIYSPETKHGINLNSAIYIIYINYMISHLVKKTTHSVPADPSSSRPIGLSLLVFVHVVSALAEHWLLFFPLPGGPGLPSPPSPKLTLFPSGPRQQPAPMPGTVPNYQKSHVTYKFPGTNSKVKIPNVRKFPKLQSSQLQNS